MSFMTVNERPLAFALLVGDNKLFVDVMLGLGSCDEHYSQFWILYRLRMRLVATIFN